MKTKLLLYIAVSSSLLLGTTSCSDFLDEKNKTGETADITYATNFTLFLTKESKTTEIQKTTYTKYGIASITDCLILCFQLYFQ